MAQKSAIGCHADSLTFQCDTYERRDRYRRRNKRPIVVSSLFCMSEWMVGKREHKSSNLYLIKQLKKEEKEDE